MTTGPSLPSRNSSFGLSSIVRESYQHVPSELSKDISVSIEDPVTNHGHKPTSSDTSPTSLDPTTASGIRWNRESLCFFGSALKKSSEAKAEPKHSIAEESAQPKPSPQDIPPNTIPPRECLSIEFFASEADARTRNEEILRKIRRRTSHHWLHSRIKKSEQDEIGNPERAEGIKESPGTQPEPTQVQIASTIEKEGTTVPKCSRRRSDNGEFDACQNKIRSKSNVVTTSPLCQLMESARRKSTSNMMRRSAEDCKANSGSRRWRTLSSKASLIFADLHRRSSKALNSLAHRDTVN